MAEQTYPCENCKFRAHYDKTPQSALMWPAPSYLKTGFTT